MPAPRSLAAAVALAIALGGAARADDDSPPPPPPTQVGHGSGQGQGLEPDPHLSGSHLAGSHLAGSHRATTPTGRVASKSPLANGTDAGATAPIGRAASKSPLANGTDAGATAPIGGAAAKSPLANGKDDAAPKDDRDLPHREALPRDVLASLLADQAASAEAAAKMVEDKLAALDRARTARAAAAYRALALPAADAMANARRRAAIRLLLARDADDRAALADELAAITTARTRIATDQTRLATLALPTSIAPPARGEIARHAGTLEHDHTKAILARRGIDLDVEAHATATAPARGTVRFAGPIRGLDRAVVLDHGDYYTVIGKLGDITVPVGASVEAGDRLGRAARHRIYLEVRAKVGPGGLPLDPEPLLSPASLATPSPAKSKRRRH